MLIRIPKGWEMPESAATPESLFRNRRRLIKAAKAFEDEGTLPPGVDDPTIYHYRSGGVILPRSADWRDATRNLMAAFVEHEPEELYEPVVSS